MRRRLAPKFDRMNTIKKNCFFQRPCATTKPRLALQQEFVHQQIYLLRVPVESVVFLNYQFFVMHNYICATHLMPPNKCHSSQLEISWQERAAGLISPSNTAKALSGDRVWHVLFTKAKNPPLQSLYPATDKNII